MAKGMERDLIAIQVGEFCFYCAILKMLSTRLIVGQEVDDVITRLIGLKGILEKPRDKK